MADPFSVFSAAAGVLDIALRATKALHGLCSELREAPALILALSNETADVSVVLGRVDEARANLARLERDKMFFVALDCHLTTARAVILRLEALISALQVRSGSIKRIKWCLRKNKASALKDDLRDVRQRINEILTAHIACV